MTTPLHIACLQTRPMATMSGAIDEAMPMARAAFEAGAEMLFLPEYCGGLMSDGARLCPPSASEDDHAVLAALRDFARENRVWVSVGSVAISAGDKIFNRGFMIDADGEIFGRYDKIHLFDVNLNDGAVYRESDTVERGGRAVLHDTPLASIGHTICYDLRFPALYRDLSQLGAQILTCPAAFTKMTGEAHWHILNRARAVENTCFMVSACAVGSIPGGGDSFGHSLVVDPWGKVLADGQGEPGVVHAALDLSLVAGTSARIPSLDHDRPYRLHRNKPQSEVA